MVVNMFLKLSRYGLIGFRIGVMITGVDISQEIFSIDMLTVLKSTLKHHRKHVLRSFQLHPRQPLTGDLKMYFRFGARIFTAASNLSSK